MFFEYEEITPKGKELWRQLIKAADEYDVICRQAPVIWDAETIEDGNMAKNGCNGGKGSPPCPLRMLCLETAMEQNIKYGVWGGLSAHERRLLKRERRLSGH